MIEEYNWYNLLVYDVVHFNGNLVATYEYVIKLSLIVNIDIAMSELSSIQLLPSLMLISQSFSRPSPEAVWLLCGRCPSL